jgi:hypothetical protein
VEVSLKVTMQEQHMVAFLFRSLLPSAEEKKPAPNMWTVDHSTDVPYLNMVK